MIKLLAIGLLSTTLTSHAKDYIVKLKNSDTKSLSSLGSVRALGFGNYALLKSNKKLQDLQLLSKTNSNIAYIEPNYIYNAFNIDGDAKFKKQWGLKNTGKNSGSIFNRGIKGIDISAVEAWKITKGSRAIKIAVIDTGVDYNHSDLSKNIMINTAELNGADGIDDDGNGYVDDIYGYDFGNNDNDPMDNHGHGTHCAGVIGASHNGQGIMGVNANVQILPIKFLKDNGSGTLEGAIKAIEYAIVRGVDVMSNSWGGSGNSEALKEMIIKAKDAGILFIAAAGNSNANNDRTMTMPAGYDVENIVSVGALDAKGKRAKFSNYGKKSVHVFAPGVDIYSTVQGNKYKKMSGTSMACPHVAGIAGLILAHEPNLSFKDIKERMMSTSIKTDELSNFTVSGYVDAYKALK
jgi:thermitase